MYLGNTLISESRVYYLHS